MAKKKGVVIGRDTERKVIISKTFKADIAHWVPTQILQMGEQKCNSLHGHTIKIEVGIAGIVNPITDMLVDFTVLKGFKDIIDSFFDHKTLVPMLRFGKDVNSILKALNTGIEWTNKFLMASMITDIPNANCPLNRVYALTKGLRVRHFGNIVSEPSKKDIIDRLLTGNYLMATFNPFTLLPLPSTTAERMAIFLTDLLEIYLINVKSNGEYVGQIQNLFIKFYETETSYAMASKGVDI